MLSVTEPCPVPANPSPSSSALRKSGTVLPPVILLGGGANALSVVRSLAGAGVPVYAINEPDAYVRYSRHCRWLSVPVVDQDIETSWASYLLGRECDHLHGAVLLSCSDAGIQVIARHRAELETRFLLDDSDREAQSRVLDKLSTYQEAVAAGVPAPRFWLAETSEQVLALQEELVYPLLVKPRLSHLFEERFGKKFIVVDNLDQLINAFDAVSDAGIETLLMEHIPGPDDLLCSYYTYLDEEGKPLFHFTKRIIRRFPVGMGTACYHITDWNPEVADLALKLCARVGLRGLANVEFKRDPRDGQLKLIECNARFTASNVLVARSGFDLALFVYNRLVGRPQRPLESYRQGLRLWDPIRDFEAFLELRRRGELTFLGWLRSILHRQSFPYFQWSDPLPAMMRNLKPLRRLLPRSGSRKNA